MACRAAVEINVFCRFKAIDARITSVLPDVRDDPHKALHLSPRLWRGFFMPECRHCRRKGFYVWLPISRPHRETLSRGRTHPSIRRDGPIPTPLKSRAAETFLSLAQCVACSRMVSSDLLLSAWKYARARCAASGPAKIVT